jgi:GTP-binding protein Era
MNRIARAALHDVDLVVFLIEADRWTKQDEYAAKIILDTTVPVILAVNKIDRVTNKSRLLSFLKDEVDTARFEHVLLISAKTGDGVEDLEALILRHLPFSRPFYDEDQFTDRSERFLAAELIREQLMLRLHQEVPYALTVEIEEFKRQPQLLRISAVIWVERESQKQIVIGKEGQTLKQIGTRARSALEQLFEQKVFLRTWVKLSRDWSDNEKSLQKLGFDEIGKL